MMQLHSQHPGWAQRRLSEKPGLDFSFQFTAKLQNSKEKHQLVVLNKAGFKRRPHVRPKLQWKRDAKGDDRRRGEASARVS